MQKSQLEQLSHELEEATHAKLVFFTNISHDFRTPLTLIADPIEQLLANRTLDGQPRQLLELMKKNVHILLRLVNQILDFRKVENGRMELHLEPFDLLDSFRGWNDSFRMALLKKHIAFSFEASPIRTPDDGGCGEDGAHLFNLFSNAVKYTPENGKITVRLVKVGNRTTVCPSSIPAATFLRPMWKPSSSASIKWTGIKPVPVSDWRWYVPL